MRSPGRLGDFLAAAAHALRPGGRAYAIYPARRMVEMISRMRAARIEPKRLRIVHSRPGGRGELLLVEGVKGGREELTVLPPLIHLRRRERIQRRDGGYFPGSFRFSRCRRRPISRAMTRSRIVRSSGSRTASRLSRIMVRSRPASGGRPGSGGGCLRSARRAGRGSRRWRSGDSESLPGRRAP